MEILSLSVSWLVKSWVRSARHAVVRPRWHGNAIAPCLLFLNHFPRPYPIAGRHCGRLLLLRCRRRQPRLPRWLVWSFFANFHTIIHHRCWQKAFIDLSDGVCTLLWYIVTKVASRDGCDCCQIESARGQLAVSATVVLGLGGLVCAPNSQYMDWICRWSPFGQYAQWTSAW